MLCYEIFKKWPLLSLFPGCICIKTSLFSLNNNFGTLNFCSGLFPFRRYNLSVIRRFIQNYVKNTFFFTISLPFREQILTDKVSTTPRYMQNIIIQENLYYLFLFCLRSQFCTCYDVIWITCLNRFRGNGFISSTIIKCR